jgi:opacity protein-like surface antigen
MKRLLGGVALAAALFAASTAQAQQSSSYMGWYGTVSAGYLQLQDVSGSIGGTSVKGEYDPGWSVSGALGWSFGNGLRTEVEGGYGRSSFDSVDIGGTKVGLSGDIDLWSAYMAAYYDFNILGVKPYLGAGAGIVHFDVDNISATANGTTFTGNGGNGTNFSAFGEAGLSFPLSDRLALVPAVRYVWIDDGGSGFDDDTAWIFKAGLRYRF